VPDDLRSASGAGEPSSEVPIWGPGSQGCLTLTRDDGTAVDLWIRHPADLRRVLGIGE